MPGTSAEEKSFDLLKQARIDLAAPLAKQLGVNPTDKDFQASLDRIFDMGTTQESRAAQIQELQNRINQRRDVLRQSAGMPPANAPAGASGGIKFLGWE